jgi:hypothetical protein
MHLTQLTFKLLLFQAQREGRLRWGRLGSRPWQLVSGLALPRCFLNWGWLGRFRLNLIFASLVFI